MYENHQPASPYAAYLNTLPADVELPLTWSDEVACPLPHAPLPSPSSVSHGRSLGPHVELPLTWSDEVACPLPHAPLPSPSSVSHGRSLGPHVVRVVRPRAAASPCPSRQSMSPWFNESVVTHTDCLAVCLLVCGCIHQSR
jgi:hypothetical protein